MAGEPNNPDHGGRPCQLTEAVIAGTERLLGEGSFRGPAAKALGFSERTFRRWMSLGRSAPDGIYGRFRAAVLRAEADLECRAIAAIRAAGATDPKHLEWLLERRFPQRWGRHRAELWAIKQELAELRRLIDAERPKPD